MEGVRRLWENGLRFGHTDVPQAGRGDCGKCVQDDVLARQRHFNPRALPVVHQRESRTERAAVFDVHGVELRRFFDAVENDATRARLPPSPPRADRRRSRWPPSSAPFSPSTNSRLASAISSTEEKFSRCAGVTRNSIATSGCAIAASRRNSPGYDMPISSTATSCVSSRRKMRQRQVRIRC